MSDPPNRDEKGLTLSGRVMLRLFMEFNRGLVAASKLGDKSDTNKLFQHPTVLLEIRSLLWIASEMAKRVGTYNEVEAYLKTHEQEDESTVLEGMKRVAKEVLDEALQHNGVPKCATCGRVKCPICRECHACSKDTNVDSHNVGPLGGFGSGPPGGSAPN